MYSNLICPNICGKGKHKIRENRIPLEEYFTKGKKCHRKLIIFNSHSFDNYKKVKVLCEQIACDERTPLDEVNSPFKKKGSEEHL